MSKVYRGVRTEPGGVSVVADEDGRVRELDKVLWLVNHSPDGFQWGYSGSGPAQLAAAILWDCTHSQERTLTWYQQFKFSVIGLIETDQWELPEVAVIRWLRQHEPDDDVRLVPDEPGSPEVLPPWNGKAT